MGSSDKPIATWAGRIVSTIVVLGLLADATVTLFAPGIMRGEMEATGFAAGLSLPLGLIMLGCAVVYAIPRTAILGAILVTGFLGGAICTHFRLGEIGSPPQLISLGLGFLTWGGLWLRDPRVRQLLR